MFDKIANLKVKFIYALFSKWYLAIILSSVIVLFWVIKGLESTGIISKYEEILYGALNDAKSIAKHCTPKITDPKAFWRCIESPPKYDKTEDKEL